MSNAVIPGPENGVTAPGRKDKAALIGLALLVLALFSGNLVTGTYPVDPFWVEIAQTHMPAQTYYRQAFHEGFWPLWQPYVSFGFPGHEHSHSYPFYPFRQILNLLDFLPAMTIYTIFHLLLLSFSSYFLFRRWGSRPEGSFFGAASMALGGYAVGAIGYHPIFATYSWTPAFLFCLTGLLREVRILRLAAFSAVAAVQILAGDLEMVFYQWLIAALFTALVGIYYRDRRQSGIKPVIAICFGLVAGCLLSSAQFFPLTELFSMSDRTGGLQLVKLKGHLGWAFREYLLTVMRLSLPVPAVAHYYNFGFLALVLGFIGWRRSDRRFRKVMGFILFFCLICAVQQFSPLQRLMSHLPVFKGFRFPERLTIFVQLAACAFASRGADYVIDTNARPLKLAAGFLAYAVISLLIVLANTKPWASYAVMLAVSGGLAAAVLAKRSFGKKAVFAILTVILAADVLLQSMVRLPESPRDVMKPYPEVIKLFRDNRSGPHAYSRSIMFGHGLDSRFFPGMDTGWGGYSPVFPYSMSVKRFNRYLKLMSPKTFEFDDNMETILRMRQFYVYFFEWDFLEKDALPWYDLSGIRYILVHHGKLKPDDPFFFGPDAHYKRISEGTIDIFENDKAYPRVFLAADAKVFPSYREAFQFMRENPGLDYRNTVILDSAPKGDGMEKQNVPEQPAPVIASYLPERITIDTDPAVDSYLVFTDSYYPGWRAYIDEKEVRILPAYGEFRAIRIARGAHRAVFEYIPGAFRIGLWSSMASLMFMAGFGVLQFLRRRSV